MQRGQKGQKSQSNPQQPDRPRPMKNPRESDRPGRESYRDPDEQKPEREIPKRANREQEDTEE